jgi:hypothetical protein
VYVPPNNIAAVSGNTGRRPAYSRVGHAALAFACAVAVGITVGSGTISPAAAIVGILVILALTFGAIARTRHGTFLHPCLILGGLLSAYGLLGFLFYPLVREHSPAPLMSSVGTGEVRTLTAFLLFGLALLITAALAPPAAVTGSSLRIDIGKQSGIVRRGVMLLLVLAPTAFLVGADIPALLQRDTYLGFTGTTIPEAMRIGFGLLFPAILLAWTVVLSPQASRQERLVAWASLLIFTLIELATGSRALGLIPVLYLLAYGLTRGRMPPLRFAIVAGLISLMCLDAALFLRSRTEHGLLPYTRATITHPHDVFISEIPSVTANLLQGFPLTTYIMVNGTNVDAHALWSALNPTPQRGLKADPTLEYRVVDYMPYNAVGMLGRLGIGIGVGYFLAIGMALAALWSFGHKATRRATIARPFLVGMTVIIGLMTLQYPLRTVTRLTTVALLGLPLLLLFAGGPATEAARATLSRYRPRTWGVSSQSEGKSD